MTDNVDLNLKKINVEMIVYTILIALFFMPWINLKLFTVAGFELPYKINDLIDFGQALSENKSGRFVGIEFLYLLYILPLLYLTNIILHAADRSLTYLDLSAALFPFSFFLISLYKFDLNLFKISHFGLFGTLFLSIVVLILSVRRIVLLNDKIYINISSFILFIIAFPIVFVAYDIDNYPDEEGSSDVEIVEVTEEGEPLSAPIFLPLDSYIVKLKNNDGSLGTRYLKTTIQLMISEKKAEEFLKNNIVLVKDLILKSLENITIDDVKNADSRERLRQNIISNISEILPSDNDWNDSSPIKKVLFEEFVLQ